MGLLDPMSWFKPSSSSLRSNWNKEMASLENALASGDYAYGGYDNALKDIYSRYAKPGSDISFQEAQGVIGGLYDKYYAPKGVKGESYAVTAPTRLTGDGDGGYSQTAAQLDAANAEIQKAYESLRPQFNQLVGQERQTLQNDYDTSKKQYTEAFGDQRNSLEKAYADAVKQIQNFYTGRNLVDSSYYQNSGRDNDLSFGYNRQKQAGKETETFSKLDKDLAEGRAAIDRLVYNYDNPNAPKFGSLDDAMQYKQQLDTQKSEVENAYSKAKTARANLAYKNSPAENTLDFVTNLQKFAAAGPAAQELVSGYIGNYIGDEKSRQYYLNLYQNMLKNNGY